MENTNCPLCKHKQKTICRALWSRIAMSNVWTKHNSSFKKWQNREREFIEVWEDIVYSMSIEELEKVVVLCRYIWCKELAISCIVFLKATKEVKEFKEAQHSLANIQKNLSRMKRDVKCQKSLKRVFKANWDSAFYATNKQMGIGIVIRDSDGELVVALSKLEEHKSSRNSSP